MFHWDDGLKLTKADLAIDFRRRQPRAFISHAHADHIARHEYTLCTPETAALCQLRLGPRLMREMPYRQPIDWGGLRLTTYPAGHCLGSAMLLAEDGGESLLYTGDFKLGESATAERAELVH
ncbi:MAG: MBL fold metallo-hydrolase, partial [Patescibacteria group bacterium]|nr:MBL fold metallo-hydrolase [Patescibacteria group bacterium]